jgi:hypothetical protein
MNESRNQSFYTAKRLTSGLNSSNQLRSNAGDTMYFTAKDESITEELICDEELKISDEAEHSNA